MRSYDLVIVGGGIHGVGVAQAAVCRGYSCLLIEQEALASGTSGRSSKLIHGGLRYLETLQFSLVRESLRERAILLKIAPDLVALNSFHIPVYADSSRGALKITAGLTLYMMLGGLGEAARFQRLRRRDWTQLDGLKTAGLRAVFRYQDAQTDDVELTRAVMKSALDLGAELSCPASFQSAQVTGSGCEVNYVEGGLGKNCQAKVLVNASGPWVNRVSRNILPRPPVLDVDLVQGAHLVMEEKLGRGCYYLQSPDDRRAVFLLPWGDHALLGTTEFLYRGDPAKVHILDDERDYLLRVYEEFFPQRSLEVSGEFAGLRVLPRTSGTLFARSRETRLMTDNDKLPRVLSIYGGKLTGYRLTAQKVMERLQPALPVDRSVADTSKLKISPAQ